MHVPSLPSLSVPQFELTESDGLANSDGSELMEEDDSEEAPRGGARTSREGHSLLCQSLVISTVARRSMVILLIMMWTPRIVGPELGLCTPKLAITRLP